MTDAPGTVIAGKYQVGKMLGEGGMGWVAEGVHQGLGTRVAIKFLRPAALEGGSGKARFLREARAAASLESEHVVRVSDVGVEGDSPYMVMEFLEGSDLARLIADQGPLPVPTSVDYLLQASDAVAEAHAHSIVHRDLKPANLFLARRKGGNTVIKVLDFGISKVSTLGAMDDASLTATQTMVGTPLYASPEQLRSSRSVDHRTDIWSLGVILHELLTGQLPFMADSVSGLIASIAADQPTPVRQLAPEVPAELEAVILRCLEKKPEQRFQSVAELAQALAPFAPPDRTSTVRRIVTQGTSGGDRAVSQIRDASRDATVQASAGSGSEAAPARTASTAEGSTRSVQPAAAHSPIGLYVGGGLLVAAIVAGGAYLVGSGRTTAGSAASGAASGAPSASNVGQGDRVEINLTATPATARLYLDGAELGSNPFVSHLAKDERLHLLEVRADGYETVKRQIVLNQSQKLELKLEPSAASAPSASSADASKATAKPSAASAAPSGAVPRPGPAPRGPLPRNPGPSGPGIIDKDPYQ